MLHFSDTATLALAWGARMINFTGEDPTPALLDAVAGADASLALTYMPYGDAYRMRGRQRVPYGVERVVEGLAPQVARAVAWLLAEGGALGCDTRRVVAAGHSAGGHLVASLRSTDFSRVDP